VLEITDAQFDQEVDTTDRPVLAYFWAAWCGPCRLVSPSIAAIAKDYGDRLKVVKLEVDPSPQAVKRCQVEGVPALRLFRNNELVASYEGAISKSAIVSFLDANL
jgi:thioredoxin 1